MKKIRKQAITNSKPKRNKITFLLLLILTIVFAMGVGNVAAADDYDNSTVNSTSNNVTTTINGSTVTGPDPTIIRTGSIVYSTNSIQDAIDHALTGDIIRLENGASFYEHDLTIPGSITELTFDVWNAAGTGPGGHATIDAQNQGRIFLINTGATVNFYNITFQNGYNTAGSAFYIWSSDLTFTGCDFINNSATSNGGAIMNNNGQLTCIGCNFINNSGGAILNYVDASGFTLNFNRFVGNTANEGRDIYDMSNDPNVPHNALYNWWGSNAGPTAGSIYNYYGLVVSDPWLIMTYSADPTSIQQGETSILTADFRYDSDGIFHDPANGHLPDGTQVTFTTNLGNVGNKSVVIGTINGVATTILRGDEAAGEALTSAILDSQTLTATVTITPATDNGNENEEESSGNENDEESSNPTVNAQAETSKTVTMQKTGLPLPLMVLAILMVFGGLIRTKRE